MQGHSFTSLCTGLYINGMFDCSALWINFPGLCVILMLSCLVGIVMYAFYSTCDPIKFGLIMASDQVRDDNLWPSKSCLIKSFMSDNRYQVMTLTDISNCG